MNTTTVKTIGKWLMVIGGGLFTAGAGTVLTADIIDLNHWLKRMQKLKKKEKNY